MAKNIPLLVHIACWGFPVAFVAGLFYVMNKFKEWSDHWQDQWLAKRKYSAWKNMINNGIPPLIAAWQCGDPQLFHMLLLELGADPNGATTDGRTPLHYLVETETFWMADFIVQLVEHGADINALAHGDIGTPLKVAARAGNQVAAYTLLSLGADINKVDSVLNEAPLHAAARYGHKTMVELLLFYGKDIIRTDLKDRYGYTAFEHLAIKWNILFK